jgi:hypothetical protein
MSVSIRNTACCISQGRYCIQAKNNRIVYYLQIGSRSLVSKEDIEDQRKAEEETKLSGIASAIGKRKFGGQTDLKRREFFHQFRIRDLYEYLYSIWLSILCAAFLDMMSTF